MDFLQNLLDSSQMPIFTAFLLGLLTAISPCPLATNITAVGFISKEIGNKNIVFFNGLLYTLGRVLSYSILGAVLIFIINKGLDVFSIQKGVSGIGELLLPPALIIFGLFMPFGSKLNLPEFGWSSSGKHEKMTGSWGSLLLGVLFALAFCPTSAMFYFGMLIPMSSIEAGGYFLPVVYAIATGLPVVIVAWLLAYSVSSIGAFYNKVKVFQLWFNRAVAIVFIVVGVYYAFVFYF